MPQVGIYTNIDNSIAKATQKRKATGNREDNNLVLHNIGLYQPMCSRQQYCFSMQIPFLCHFHYPIVYEIPHPSFSLFSKMPQRFFTFPKIPLINPSPSFSHLGVGQGHLEKLWKFTVQLGKLRTKSDLFFSLPCFLPLWT